MCLTVSEVFRGTLENFGDHEPEKVIFLTGLEKIFVLYGDFLLPFRLVGTECCFFFRSTVQNCENRLIS